MSLSRAAGAAQRRARIADAAIETLAAGGARALTHHAVDARLGLATGSTSYYYRTRESLRDAAIELIVQRSREAFAALMPGPARARPLEEIEVVAVITAYLDHALRERRSDLLARMALLGEVIADPAPRALLAASLFSREGAAEIFASEPDPELRAQALIAGLEGLLFQGLYGEESISGTAELVIDGLLAEE